MGTIQFALDNVSYEIELSTANAARLSEGLARFVENGKKVQHPQGGKAASRRGVPPVAVGREHVQAHLRSSLEALGHAPSVWVFSGRLAAASISRGTPAACSICVSSRLNTAARKLWGVPVTASTAIAAGTAVLCEWSNYLVLSHFP